MLGIGPRLVDMFKEAYESVEVPKYVDTVTPEYKPKFDALLVELKEADASLKESGRLEKEIVEVQELKQKISTMTTDEYFEKRPEILFTNRNQSSEVVDIDICFSAMT
ncbi:ATP synthase subunit d, mitochondrial-like [Camellia sinensis]|uniref:ATP synthase subunit d, mitochondrial-like n=1 Tax=Camellia sinensis TaxID=4442 RepID=UPI001035F352|nr:ATP synthase subunit d, mitochondrial-like [Camellia sinensis]